MSHLCRICLSPYRPEIVAAWNQGIPRKNIHLKYAQKMGYMGGWHGFQQMCLRHVKGNHESSAVLVPTPKDSAVQVSKATLEGYAKRMLDLGMQKAQETSPDKVAFKDVHGAIKLQLDAQKLKIAEDALMVQMSKMFGPDIKIIEGEEVVDGVLGTGRDESTGV